MMSVDHDSEAMKRLFPLVTKRICAWCLVLFYVLIDDIGISCRAAKASFRSPLQLLEKDVKIDPSKFKKAPE